MKQVEQCAFAGTTAVTLLAVAAFCCIIASAPAGRAGDLQTTTARTGAWVEVDHQQGAQQ